MCYNCFVGKISVVINVVDEEVNLLPRVLASIKNLASEIILVDMTSGDELKKLVEKFDAKAYKHERVDYVELVRNFGVSKASNEWILVLDPDEEVSKFLAEELKKISADSKSADYFRIPRKNVIFGKWIKHSRWWPDMNIRFFKKGCVNWDEIIHAVPMTTGRGMDLEEKEENALIHYHYETVEQYIQRMNRYTTAQAKNLVREGYKFDWRDLLRKPTNEFLSRFFRGEGYKDGLHGLVLAGLQAFSELVTYLKIWQIDKFQPAYIGIEEIVREMREAESELHYWQSDALLKEIGGLKHRIKRKFKL